MHSLLVWPEAVVIVTYSSRQAFSQIYRDILCSLYPLVLFIQTLALYKSSTYLLSLYLLKLCIVCIATALVCQDEETEALLTADFEIGHFFRESIIPRAVLYFTGEALEDDEDDDEVCATVLRCFDERIDDLQRSVLTQHKTLTLTYPRQRSVFLHTMALSKFDYYCFSCDIKKTAVVNCQHCYNYFQLVLSA